MKYLKKFNDSDLTPLEQDVIRALKTSVLGREGSIFYEMFSGDGQRAVDSLMEKGIVVEIKGHQSYSNHLFIGLYNEVYPESQQEFIEYRNSGYSEKGSYSEFIAAQHTGKVKWDAARISSFLDNDVQNLFKEKMQTTDFFINYCNKVIEAIQYAQKLVREDNSADEVLVKLFTKYMSDSFTNLEPIDKNWYINIIEKRIEYLKSLK
jgi:hypothetical protein